MRHKFLCAILVLQLVFLCNAPMSAAEELSMSSTKGGFMLLYNSEWRLFNLNYRLFTIIGKEFDSRTQSMMFGTSGLQLALNKNHIIEKIQSEIFEKFKPEYEAFLKSFQSKYYTLLKTNPARYSLEKIEQAPSFNVIETIQHEGERKMLDNIGAMLGERLEYSLLSPYYSLIFLVAGLLILIFNGAIARSLPKTQGQRTRVILAVVAIVMISFGTFQVSRGIFFTQVVTRDFLNEQTRLLYMSELPDSYWNVLESHVRSAMK